MGVEVGNQLQHPNSRPCWACSLDGLMVFLREVGSGSAARHLEGLTTSCSKPGTPPLIARPLQAAAHLGSRRAA